MNGEWREIMRAVKTPVDGDGQSCAVDVCEMPAQFYRVRALPDTNSVGAQVEPFMLSTGSGDECKAWAMRTAYLIARGMVGLAHVGTDEVSQ